MFELPTENRMVTCYHLSPQYDGGVVGGCQCCPAPPPLPYTGNSSVLLMCVYMMLMLTLHPVQPRPAGRWRDYRLPGEGRGVGIEEAGNVGAETQPAEALERK